MWLVGPVKTLTEFAVSTLKNAAQVQKDLLAGGKTTEELPAALGEALKVEGDKLTRLQAALEVAGDKFNDLKRVIVFTIAEGEKTPTGAQQKGENWFVAEYFAPMNAKKGQPEKDAKGRGPRDGKKGKGGGRGGPGRGGDRDGGGKGKPGGDRGPRRDNRGGGPTPVITPVAKPTAAT